MQQIYYDQNYQALPPPGYPYPPPQEEKEVHLRDYWRVIRKRQWTVIAFFLIVLITTAIATYTMRPVYRGTVTIQIDKEYPNIVDFKEIFSVNMWDLDYYQTQYKILESRTLAKRVVQSVKLAEHPEFQPQPETPFQKWKSNLFNSVFGLFKFSKKEDIKTTQTSPETEKEVGLISGFLGSLKIEPIRNSRLVKVHYDSTNPELAAQVPNVLANSYIKQNLESRFNATEQAKDWLSNQIDILKGKVEKADEALHEFGLKHGIVSLDEKENIIMQRLTELNDVLTKAESDRMAKEALYRQSRDQDFDSLPVILENKVIQELKQSLIQLEAQYAKLAEIYKSDYPEMVRLRKQMASLQKRLDAETQRVVQGVRSDYESSRRKEALVRAAFEEQKARTMEMKDRAIQYNILKREADTNRELYRDLLQRMKQAGVSAGMTASNIKVIDQAEIPRDPYKPNKKMNLLLAVVVGLFLGVGLAFFFEYLDNTIKTPEDVEQLMRLPSFGMVPELSYDKKKRIEKSAFYPVELITHGHPKSVLSEAYRNIRTSILLSFSEKPPKKIAITSANPFEGKTTTVINTAIALSQTGAQVLVIDGDMRKPRVHKVFEEDGENGAGLSNYLSGIAELKMIIKKTEVPNLYYVPAGPIPPNPSELLGSKLFKTMLQTLSEKFDHIILDSPPVLGFADAVVIASAIDGVVLVALGGKTPKDTLQHAKEALLQVNAKILGVVINRIDIQRSYYGYYYYRYHYYYGKERKKELTYTSENDSPST
jgi:succinoglycan biosynthesis transport protein ExoP